MPGLNGLDVCRAVRSRAGAGYTYIVLLTGNSRPQDAITALEAGADDFISKPFHPHEMKARLNAAQRILNLEESLARRAFYDHLTGLPNRTRLAELFRIGRDTAAQDSQMLGVLYIDLDHFKLVNDSLGHAAGDAMLVGVADRLKDCIGPEGTLARVGGDEFVLLAGVSTPAASASLSKRLLEALTDAIDAAGHRFYSSASIGVSLYPRDGDEFDSLLMKADAAMYESKRRIRNSFQLFTEEIGERFRSRLTTESRLTGAVQRMEFALHY
jgi:diguanylate cyclase (GGDEF)-like protein